MVVVAIVVIFASIAVPNFSAWSNNRRLEGVAQELQTDMQLARSLAVQRNSYVCVTTTASAYYLTASSTTTCPTSGLGGLKTRSLTDSGVVIGNSGLGTFYFEPLRSSASALTTLPLSISGVSSSLAVTVTTTGRSVLCDPAGTSFKGYPACPTT